ncbi:hypothetical protein FRACYDRAFT_265503 [Fragilariopsis cylindrus CCMP1102]|uniref:Uncharacterized protein n=1 Tax=Fragilariopsis cylindrus CCMP1102 TaxID=635003 RepID=A0A1E7ELI3_9STRA|nr:hypothetical protein FRACYDRAFT_265503 [Fragilariopsis cylindrus CCMP1102]|eukprot:OEU06789.1 hypothetical protein FRACYDRAFT_265503 [Fragilariopsis cylindrus CCMP1102]
MVAIEEIQEEVTPPSQERLLDAEEIEKLVSQLKPIAIKTNTSPVAPTPIPTPVVRVPVALPKSVGTTMSSSSVTYNSIDRFMFDAGGSSDKFVTLYLPLPGKLGSVDGYGRSRKSDEEVKMAIEEARDLNGVNPIVAIGGSFFAFAVAAALWYATNQLGSYFVSHPPATDVYFVIRSAQVFRNVVMGLISLAAGFFGVCGLGIFGMGVRVAYGIANGELDPTPIVSLSKPKETVNMSKMMDLMMNKKPGRRGGGKK